MYKVRPVFHSGFEFVQLSMLPAKQAEQIMRKIADSSLRNVKIGEMLLEGCISYEDYEQWYQLIGSQNYDNYFESQL
jgi:hypothetical protein